MSTSSNLSSENQKGVTMLFILADHKLTGIELDRQKRWVLGRKAGDNTPDINVSSRIVSRKHGELICIEGCWYYSNNSQNINATFYNGREIKPGFSGQRRPIELKHGDNLRIDFKNLKTPDSRGVLMLFIRVTSSIIWEQAKLSVTKPVFIGSDPLQCSIICRFPEISQKHAKIAYLNHNYYLSSCNDEAKVWVRGEQIESSIILQEKDCFSLDGCYFIFTDGTLFYMQPDYRNG